MNHTYLYFLDILRKKRKSMKAAVFAGKQSLKIEAPLMLSVANLKVNVLYHKNVVVLTREAARFHSRPFMVL